MKQIEAMVNQVVRRLFLQDFVTRFPFYLLGCLAVALALVAVPKLIHWPPLSAWAAAGWWVPALGWGAVGLALLLCWFSCWRTRVRRLLAAEELDRRFGLQERVSSTMAARVETSDPDFYRALLADTEQRISQLQVSEHFPIQSRWSVALPIPAILLLIGLMYVPDVAAPERESAEDLTEETREQVSQLIKAANVKKESEESPDPDAELAHELVKKAIEDAEEVLSKKDSTKREVLVAINDVKKAVQDQQERLGKTDALKDRLKQLKEQMQGPAEKFNRAIKDGDMKEAQDQLAQLAEKLAKGEMSQEQQAQMAQQMEQLAEQLDNASQAFEEQQQELQRQIEQALADGDLQRAADLEKQKADLQRQQRQIDQLRKLGQQANELADLLKQAAEGRELDEQQLENLRECLGCMQGQMQEMDLDAGQMQELQDLMDQMEQIKQRVQGDGQCEGGECDGDGDLEAEGGQGGGIGRQRGTNPGADDQDDAPTYETRVRPEVGQGQVTKIGQLGGPNRKGVSQLEIQEAIREASENRELTPNELQDVPANQRDHVRQYFQRLRGE